jgi:hypothetical protein
LQTLSAIDLTSQNILTFTNPQFSTAASMGLCLRVFPQSDARQGAGILASGGSSNGATDLSLFVSTGSSSSTSFAAYNVTGNSTTHTWYNGAGTTALTLDSSGNLCLGLTPVGSWGTQALMFAKSGAGSPTYPFIASTDTQTVSIGSNSYWNGSAWKAQFASAITAMRQDIGFNTISWNYAPAVTAGTTQSFVQGMTFDNTGNLGLGTTSLTYRFNLKAPTGIWLNFSDGVYQSWQLGNDANGIYYNNPNGGYQAWQINGTERARIDSSGNLLVGTTSNSTYSEKFNITTGSSTQVIMNLVATGTSSFGAVKFRNGSGEIGSISYLASAVIYNTTSDYRLKTVVGAVTGHGARIDALKPIDYQWKTSNEQARGFLAHEFKEVYPNSVTGEKDDVDADGNPVYQSMQASTSEVIADLVAEIQSLRKRLADAGIA